jgi:DNA-binding CsgD family transcriptional regulator
VRTHVRALYRKLGVENRAEAVNLGWSHGLLRRPT